MRKKNVKKNYKRVAKKPKNIDISKNSEKIKNSENIENVNISENSEKIKNIENTENINISGNSEKIKNSENTENINISENFGKSENSENTENKDISDLLNDLNEFENRAYSYDNNNNDNNNGADYNDKDNNIGIIDGRLVIEIIDAFIPFLLSKLFLKILNKKINSEKIKLKPEQKQVLTELANNVFVGKLQEMRPETLFFISLISFYLGNAYYD